MTENNLIFCDYSNSHLEDCLKLFDQNCPKYFATNERQDYIAFLQKQLLQLIAALHGNNYLFK